MDNWENGRSKPRKRMGALREVLDLDGGRVQPPGNGVGYVSSEASTGEQDDPIRDIARS